MHGEHRVDQDSLVQELVGFDILAVVCHVCEHLNRIITVNISRLVKEGCVQSVDDAHAEQACLSIVLLGNLDVFLANLNNLNRTCRRFLFEVVRLD